MPPVIADVLLPHLSARRKAGTDIASISIPDTPDARNDAVAEESPACEKSRGAYYCVVSIQVRMREADPGQLTTHVKHAVNPGKLDHAQHEQSQDRSRPVSSPEEDGQALPQRQADSLLGDSAGTHEVPLSLHHREVKPAQRVYGGRLVATAHRPPRRFRQSHAAPDQDDRHEHHYDERQPPRHT